MIGQFKPTGTVQIKGSGIPDWTHLCNTGEVVVRTNTHAQGGTVDVSAFKHDRRTPEYCVSARITRGSLQPLIDVLDEMNREYEAAVQSAIRTALDWIEYHAEGLGHA